MMACPICESDHCQCLRTVKLSRTRLEEELKRRFYNWYVLRDHHRSESHLSLPDLLRLVQVFGQPIFWAFFSDKTGKNNRLLFLLQNGADFGVLELDPDAFLHKTWDFNGLLFVAETIRDDIVWEPWRKYDHHIRLSYKFESKDEYDIHSEFKVKNKGV